MWEFKLHAQLLLDIENLICIYSLGFVIILLLIYALEFLQFIHLLLNGKSKRYSYETEVNDHFIIREIGQSIGVFNSYSLMFYACKKIKNIHIFLNINLRL